jgi:hypothetical protein
MSSIAGGWQSLSGGVILGAGGGRVAQPFKRSDLGGAALFTNLVKGAGFRLAASMQRERESAGNPLVASQRMGGPIYMGSWKASRSKR